MNISGAIGNSALTSAVPSVSGNNAEMMQILENSQKATTELAEKMLKATAVENSVIAEMTGIGTIVDMYV